MDIRREDGVALIVALMATMLMTALGVALILTTSSETMITANYRNGQEALYAADAQLMVRDHRRFVLQIGLNSARSLLLFALRFGFRFYGGFAFRGRLFGRLGWRILGLGCGLGGGRGFFFCRRLLALLRQCHRQAARQQR